MRIVVLEPFLSEVFDYLGLADSIVGVPHGTDFPEQLKTLPSVTATSVISDGELEILGKALASSKIDISQVVALNPDVVVLSAPTKSPQKVFDIFSEYLERRLSHPVKVFSVNVTSLDRLYQTLEILGDELGKGAEARTLSHRIKAQLMDWGANFNARTRNKKVTVIASANPLMIASQWVSDLIKSCSAIPQSVVWEDLCIPTSWKEIEAFRPDVIVVSLIDKPLEDALRLFPTFEKLKEWEGIPAVKRGEVIFMDGLTLYRPGPRLLDGAGMLISAIAGLDSGYITKRDSFQRLRWLELNRHKLP